MDKKALLALLQNIYSTKYVGVVKFEVLAFAQENGLLERTEEGNFSVTEKGLQYLDLNEEQRSIEN
jgi:hypothetical protein